MMTAITTPMIMRICGVVSENEGMEAGAGEPSYLSTWYVEKQ